MKHISIIIAALALVVAISVAIFGGSSGSNLLAGVSNYDSLEAEGLAIGDGCDNEQDSCTGTTFTQILSGSCNASFSHDDKTLESTGSMEATTTGRFFCTATGAASGDRVFVFLPIGANSAADGNDDQANGFAIVNAYATTTNRIGFDMFNFTGAATSSFTQATTSVKYLILR